MRWPVHSHRPAPAHVPPSLCSSLCRSYCSGNMASCSHLRTSYVLFLLHRMPFPSSTWLHPLIPFPDISPFQEAHPNYPLPIWPQSLFYHLILFSPQQLSANDTSLFVYYLSLPLSHSLLVPKTHLTQTRLLITLGLITLLKMATVAAPVAQHTFFAWHAGFNQRDLA